VRALRRLRPHSLLFRYYNRNRIGCRECILEGIVEHLFLMPPRALGAVDVVRNLVCASDRHSFQFPRSRARCSDC
jgi:hypothetical protein